MKFSHGYNDFRLRDSHGHPTAMTVPNLPAAVGARVHVEGHGQGTYVRFDFNVLSPVLHCIDFDEGGEKTFRGDSACRDRWCRRPRFVVPPHQKVADTIQWCWPSGWDSTRPVANGWRVVDDLGSVHVYTLIAPAEVQTIALKPANMSMCELRVEIAQRLGVPPEHQRLVIQGQGEGDGEPSAEGSGSGEHELGSDPSATVWSSGVRAGMRILVCAVEPRVPLPPRRPPRPQGGPPPPGATETYVNVLSVETNVLSAVGAELGDWPGLPPPPGPQGAGGPPGGPPEPPEPGATVDEGPWSVEQVVRLRREALESEVARVKEKADRVGTMLGQGNNKFAICLAYCMFGFSLVPCGVLFGDIGMAVGGAISGVMFGTYCVIIIETQTRAIAHCAALRGDDPDDPDHGQIWVPDADPAAAAAECEPEPEM
eukprot:SAG22_NODE_1263_length_4967_cov_5.836278_2_plen_427_part_00